MSLRSFNPCFGLSRRGGAVAVSCLLVVFAFVFVVLCFSQLSGKCAGAQLPCVSPIHVPFRSDRMRHEKKLAHPCCRKVLKWGSQSQAYCRWFSRRWLSRCTFNLPTLTSTVLASQRFTSTKCLRLVEGERLADPLQRMVDRRSFRG